MLKQWKKKIFLSFEQFEDEKDRLSWALFFYSESNDKHNNNT